MAQEVNITGNPLETEPVGKLIRKYSIPTAMAIMVNNFYNIVDQIFLGQGVGITAMAATNVAFPLTIVGMALALMLGDGSAAAMSLCLGRREQKEAERIAGHGVALMLYAGALIALISFFGAPWIVRLLGTTESAYVESVAYMRVTAWGLPFLMLCASLTAVIRADGNPKYTMKCMMVGAVVNVVLDYIFIFPLAMGVVGAGIATVIGEWVSGVLCLWYLPRLKLVTIHREDMKLTAARSAHILKMGVPSFITQIMTAAVQITMNNLMTRCGAMTVYGGDIALSVYGMMMKIYQIAHAMFVGVSSATQPINGFNFGAKHYERVSQTYRLAGRIALIISVCWFAVYMLLPRLLGMMFVADDPVYLDACAHIFRFYMMGFFVYGLHITTSSFFQSIGQPKKALSIPMVRQGVVLIPMALLLSTQFGLDGALLAAPIADVVSFLLSVGLVTGEFRRWRQQGWLTENR